jgi:hypothetical protein
MHCHCTLSQCAYFLVILSDLGVLLIPKSLVSHGIKECLRIPELQPVILLLLEQSLFGASGSKVIDVIVFGVDEEIVGSDNILKGDDSTYNPPHFPQQEVAGLGLHEAPRGTLSHWVVVDKGTFSNYQAVVPTTWNASPRDERGVPGPYESSLVGNPVADPERPLEVLRTVHSFDPCMACACHMLDASGRRVAQVKVL